MQYSIVQDSTVKYNTVKYSTVKCARYSGRLASYTEKEEMERIYRYLAKRGHMYSSHCSSDWGGGQGTLGRNVEVFLAGDDVEQEGVWMTWYENTAIHYLPWAPNRPTKNGEANNCIMLKVRRGYFASLYLYCHFCFWTSPPVIHQCQH